MIATPLNDVEVIVCLCMMLIGSLLFAYLVGSFCGLAANLAPDTVRFRQDLTDLNKFHAAHAIPKQLRYALREFMHQTVYLRRNATGNRLLGKLSSLTPIFCPNGPPQVRLTSCPCPASELR